MTKSAHGRKYATGHLAQDDRLVQVSKGVYASGAVLENEFTVEYSYDSMGRMLRRDNGSEVTTFVWDGWDLLSETTDSVTTTYLVPDGPVWSFVRGEEVFQVHTDALGSVRVVTDSEGDVVARFEYGAWGELLPGSFDDVGLALRFVGGLGVRTDLETGLVSMRHRWYDANSQRFISRDPIGLRGGANLFTYVANNPVNWVDPSGLDPIWIGTGKKIRVSHDICGTRRDVTYDDEVTIADLKDAFENTTDLMVLFAHNWASHEGVHLEDGSLRLEQLRAWKRRPRILFLAGCRTDDNVGMGRMDTPPGMATVTLKNVTEMKHIRRFLRPFIRNLEAGQTVQDASDNALNGIRNSKAADALRGTIRIQGGDVRL